MPILSSMVALPSASIKSRWTRISIVIFVATVVLNFTFFAYKPHIYTRFLPNSAPKQEQSATTIVACETPPLSEPPPAEPLLPITILDIIQALYQPLIKPVAAPSYTAADGIVYNISSKPRFTESLGKKLCIVDIDTRPFNGTDELLDPGKFNWDKFSNAGTGMLNHYLYTLIHGYTYKFIRTTPFPDRIAMWTKISALADTLGEDDCHITLSIDADATFMDLALPFEWLLNRWNVTPNTSLTMPRDPDAPQNIDASHGGINLNCGFIIAQDLARTQQILRAWAACPDDEARYPNCSRWKVPWPAEQAAFGEYIRYEFNATDDIRPIACDEANGFPDSGSECRGVFVRHHWSQKGLVKSVMADAVAGVALSALRAGFLSASDDLIVVRETNNFTKSGGIVMT